MNTIFKTTLRPGEKWSGFIGKGKLLRFTALGDGANLAVMLYNRLDISEKYSMPDSLKAQHTFRLTKGDLLMSDNGRVLAAIVEDSLGWHDAVGGLTTRELTDSKYGKTVYQDVRNDWLRSGYENFMVELVKSGLSARDMAPPINLFSKVSVDKEGNMSYDVGHCKKGAAVTLRTEMDIILILSNTPNPVDQRSKYPSVPICFEVLPAAGINPLDECVGKRPENRRAYENTWDYYALLGE